ncbi:predicted protein [Phaeodactylum tricornutum CCAP 1055/1]|jgi:hypothetical protein|uniref:Ribosome maturation protein SDO1/SBDS N-terminal domain-containing protein n=2 Tax=Phaeodactylum tricornutum TaxID=2850 RepID=B7S439_PHATC|nr:predicted protein [Phaeodactylum tricornutum CCAP 1055/1]EEC42699.1 predicted protein [Phaeodactylum tricornutum CCAP 1055/1]|eukprot:XP_002176307.1 predicted protein [Phaeodactylum tricornutum CCAP 1055/1]
MPLKQLIFTPQDIQDSSERPITMVLLVDEDMYEKQKKDKSIPMVNVVDSFQVFKYEKPGSSGRLAKPTKEEIEGTFGTSKEEDVVLFMLENGTLHGKMVLEHDARNSYPGKWESRSH